MIAGVLEIQMMANMARLSDDMRRAERVVDSSMGKIEHSVAKAGRAMSSFGLGLSVGLIADQLRRTTDTYIKLDAQLRLSTDSQQQYNQAMADVRRISGVAQSDIAATTMLYTRLLNVMDGTGVSQGKLATVTETVSYGLKAYGATAAEAASASLQLSQAMGANRLGGEEFRAVMEAMPNVMKVLAASMGVPLGELRALSIAGKITAAEMVKAFGDPAVAAMFKKMAESTQTVTGAWTVMRNEFTLLFGEFGKQSGLVAVVIASFKLLGESMRVLGQYVGDLVTMFGAWAAFVAGRYVVGILAARQAQWALNAAHVEALAMNVAMEQAMHAELVSRMSGIAAIRAQTLAELAARQSKQALAVADAEATVAQLTHARAAGMLSGHLHIVRQVEAELVVATNALTVANQRRAATMAEMVALGKLQTASNAQIAASSAGVAAAQTAQTAATGGLMRATMALIAANAPLLAILALAAAVVTLKHSFEDSIDPTGKFSDKIRGMGLEALYAARHLEEARLSQMSFKGSFNEREARATEDRIRMLNAQIEAEKKLSEMPGAGTGRGTGASASDVAAWDKLHQTKKQKRDAEIAELNDHYLRLINVQTLTQARSLELARQYQVKLAEIMSGDVKKETKAADDKTAWLEKYNDAAIELADGLDKYDSVVRDAKLKRIKDVYDEEQRLARENSAVMMQFAENTQRGIGDIFFNGLNGKFDSVAEMFRQLLYRMAADAMAAKLAQAMFGSNGQGGAGSLIGTVISWMSSSPAPAAGATDYSLASAYAGGAPGGPATGGTPYSLASAYAGRASGGPVTGGTPYVVGEVGPELFVPKSSGTIVPNSAMGGTSVTYAPTINIDSRTDKSEVERLVSNAVQQGNAQLVDKLQRSGRI